MKWNNLETLPEDGKPVWVLNQEYGDSKLYDPLCQKIGLCIRDATFHRCNGWKLSKTDVYPSVKYWTYQILPEEETKDDKERTA